MSQAGAGGPTRRGFLLTVGGAAAALGCQRKASPVDPGQVEPGCPPGRANADVLAVRDHRLHVDTPPSFVFSTGFRDVP